MSADSKKELYIVGLGPGARQKMTQEAIDVVEACEVIAGYKVYIDLLKPYYPDKEYLVNGMRQEVERCRLALETAAGGKKTALVCSGDAGVGRNHIGAGNRISGGGCTCDSGRDGSIIRCGIAWRATWA